MHQPIPDQGKWLAQVIRGYFRYHAVPTNEHALAYFRDAIVSRWMWALNRRSQRRSFGRWNMKKLADDWLPKPSILFPWPNQRFAVRHSR